jgi:hypothetical protein
MIIPLQHGKVASARPRRAWSLRTQATPRSLAAFGTLIRREDQAVVGPYLFRLLFGSVVLLLIFDLVGRHIAGILFAGLIMIYLACSKLTTQHCDQTRERRARQQARCARQATDLQRLNLDVGECQTIAALERHATERAAAIANAAALVQLFSSAAPPPRTNDRHAFSLSLSGEEGRLTIFRAQDELSQAQRSALEHLAVLVGVQAARLRGVVRLARQQAALMVLWQVAGVLRSALDPQKALGEACGRMTTALELNWLALLAPDERQSLATLLISRGNSGKPAPHLTGAQLRVAAEALRAECALIRSEGQQALTCLPIRMLGGAPVILAVHGETLDAAAQSLLLLFGEMIVERLARAALEEGQLAPDGWRSIDDHRSAPNVVSPRESALA